ncbi:acetyltransferase [Bacillus sp. J14TS2]|uniref:aminoglycoside phosphotransferase family protein n=1 Tax=Bacillus sp. J14TS2 TaxID=2807188 RepID=UPI001B0C7003|nr:aminoglycoside phosphotransferase family protein [Bacillus sp. J14TS2]GIN72834.1 acetyltransferase [Bacillus sp. J14TS2]
MEIKVELVKQLIREQFPQWKELHIKPVKNGGHDNRTFHLGETMTIRLPSGKDYEPQVKKEARWLPYLAKGLALPITEPVAIGKPTDQYPYVWSINKWLPGETVTQSNVKLTVFAEELAAFLKELQRIDASNGPTAGVHNFYRGGELAVYDSETMAALKNLNKDVQLKKCQRIWQRSLASKWEKEGVWVHGDVAAGNLLVQNGHLSGVIDFGILGVGDPACDFAMAWTFFDRTSRQVFKEQLDIDEGTWNRAKGWALWKALITYNHEEKKIREHAQATIKEILADEDDYE